MDDQTVGLADFLAETMLRALASVGEPPLPGLAGDHDFQSLQTHWRSFTASATTHDVIVPEEEKGKLLSETHALIIEGMKAMGAVRGELSDIDAQHKAFVAMANLISAGVKMGGAIETAWALPKEARRWQAGRRFAEMGRKKRLATGETKRAMARAIGAECPGISLTACGKRVAAQFQGDMSESGIRNVIRPLFEMDGNGKWHFKVVV